jgi:hypothetical protein
LPCKILQPNTAFLPWFSFNFPALHVNLLLYFTSSSFFITNLLSSAKKQILRWRETEAPARLRPLARSWEYWRGCSFLLSLCR